MEIRHGGKNIRFFLTSEIFIKITILLIFLQTIITYKSLTFGKVQSYKITKYQTNIINIAANFGIGLKYFKEMSVLINIDFI